MAWQPDRVKQMIGDYLSVFAVTAGKTGGFEGARVRRGCGFGFSVAVTCLVVCVSFAEVLWRARGAGLGCSDVTFDTAAGVGFVSVALRTAGLAACVFGAAAFRAADFGGLATGLGDASAGFVSGFATAAGCAFAFGAAAVARGFAENATTGSDFGFGFGAGFLAAGEALTAPGFARFVTGFAVAERFGAGFLGAEGSAEVGVFSALIDAIGSSIADRVMICMIFSWFTIAYPATRTAAA
ncbi:hypothetical protein [uncultured Ruegeria sp.]|uniref:hypothetical protein n=1 Tax=uncultured Ruegeria sp. TaxID=259304 RepID=UPI00263103E2|nr:hypothetical protein [uncultured Ruegeria sp.]